MQTTPPNSENYTETHSPQSAPPPPNLDAIEEAKKEFRHANASILAAIKRSAQLALRLTRHPLTATIRSLNLSWVEIIATFALISLLSALVRQWMNGFGLEAIFLSVSTTLSGLVFGSVIIAAIYFVLDQLERTQTARDIAEVWLAAAVPTAVFGMLASMALHFTLASSFLSLGVLVGILTGGLHCFLLFLAFILRFRVPRRSALIIIGSLFVLMSAPQVRALWAVHNAEAQMLELQHLENLPR